MLFYLLYIRLIITIFFTTVSRVALQHVEGDLEIVLLFDSLSLGL